MVAEHRERYAGSLHGEGDLKDRHAAWPTVDQVADKHDAPAQGVLITRTGSNVPQLAQQCPQLIHTSVHIADDVKRRLVVGG